MIGLPQPMIVQLKLHEIEQNIERGKAGDHWEDGGWLFTSETGQPLNHRTDQARWKQLLAAAGVRDARLHDARHTAATVLLELGVPDRATMQIMGRSNAALAQRYNTSTATLLAIYADLRHQADESEAHAAAMDRARRLAGRAHGRHERARPGAASAGGVAEAARAAK
jgi:integrase